jgi:hypothetical protein
MTGFLSGHGWDKWNTSIELKIDAGRGVRVPVPQRSVPKEREPISKSIFIHF